MTQESFRLSVTEKHDEFIPAAGAVIAIVALWFYRLDEDTVKQMSAELAVRRGEAEPAAA